MIMIDGVENMKNLSIIIISDGVSNKLLKNIDNIEVLFSNGKNILEIIGNVKTKYVSFFNDDDELADNYIDILLKKTEEEFDSCYINYSEQYDYVNENKILKNKKELKCNKPYYGEYIWSFIFNTEKLKNTIDYYKINGEINFKEFIDLNFKNNDVIEDVLYKHNQINKRLISNFCYLDNRETEHYKNVIYVGNGCNGTFNGYISWLKNIGRCFSSKYEIVVLYENIYNPTLVLFEKYFKCVKRNPEKNYLCDRLLVTYSTYFYPRNICVLEENYMFIHGNMSDYTNTKRFYDDLYTRYIAVSKIAVLKAKGYFPTDNIECLYNPFKLDPNLLTSHLRLVSAQRSSDVKRPERIEILASVLDELDLPYTWNVFTDKNENTNKGGVVYRRRVQNPLPYIKDSDYFVLLSDSEALPYCIVEALSLNTKVLVTPLEAFFELGVKDGENGIVIPFEYFEPENRQKLKDIVRKMYLMKDKKINYKFDESTFDGYNELFKE